MTHKDKYLAESIIVISRLFCLRKNHAFTYFSIKVMLNH